MTFEVKLIKNYRSQVFGTYLDAGVAESIAAEHRSSGYWDADGARWCEPLSLGSARDGPAREGL